MLNYNYPENHNDHINGHENLHRLDVNPSANNTLPGSFEIQKQISAGIVDQPDPLQFSMELSRNAMLNSKKPKYSLASLIGQAILATEGQKARLTTIYEWISKCYPDYYKMNHGGWQNSIRHNLTINKAFTRLPKDECCTSGKGSYWTISPEHLHQFKDGVFVGKIRGGSASTDLKRKTAIKQPKTHRKPSLPHVSSSEIVYQQQARLYGLDNDNLSRSYDDNAVIPTAKALVEESGGTYEYMHPMPLHPQQTSMTNRYLDPTPIQNFPYYTNFPQPIIYGMPPVGIWSNTSSLMQPTDITMQTQTVDCHEPNYGAQFPHFLTAVSVNDGEEMAMAQMHKQADSFK